MSCDRELIQTVIERIIVPVSCPQTVIESQEIRTDVIERLIAGPPGASGVAGYRAHVEPSGDKDGVNVVFTFPDDPLEPTFELFQNGILEDPDNYSLVGNVLTVTTPPKAWWRLAASYFV